MRDYLAGYIIHLANQVTHLACYIICLPEEVFHLITNLLLKSRTLFVNVLSSYQHNNMHYMLREEHIHLV